MSFSLFCFTIQSKIFSKHPAHKDCIFSGYCFSMLNLGINHDGALARTPKNQNGEEVKLDMEDLPARVDVYAQHFLCPQPVMFAHQPVITPTVIAVSCGVLHMLVVARDPNSNHGKLYTSGFNGYGQLGHGDTENRNVLTLVRCASKELHSTQLEMTRCV